MKDPLPLTEKGEIKMKLSSYGCKNIIITRNSKGVIAWFGDRRIEVKTPPVKPLVSTIGAGDSFNAGIIYALVKRRIIKDGLGNIPPGTIETILESGISFASDVCKTVENYISPGFSNRLRS